MKENNNSGHFSFPIPHSSFVQGCECSLAIKTADGAMDVPYFSETLREAVSLLYEEAAIEGDGTRRAVRKAGGVTGCVVTPLSIGTAPVLLFLALGAAGKAAFVSGTRNMYGYRLSLVPLEDTGSFEVIQDRGKMSNEQLGMRNERKYYEGCRVKGFELRFLRGEAAALKLDVCGENAPSVYPYTDTFNREQGERFQGDCVSYRINGQEYQNIYGLTVTVKKEGGTRTEVWIRRAAEQGTEVPGVIEELVITARLVRDTYEARRFGTFVVRLARLVLVSDETEIDCAGAVIGPLRYYAAGEVSADVFEERNDK